MKNALEKLKSAYMIFKENNKTFKSKIPTILTSVRLFAPIVVVPLVLTGNIIPALIASGVAASTDFFDGLLARKLHAESDFGAILDPIVDKVFLTTLILCGASINPILLINIAPEVAIAINNSKAFNENKNVASSTLGRVKTWILSLDTLINLLPGLSISIKSAACYFTFAFQTLTYAKYKNVNDKTAIVNRTYTDLNNDEKGVEILEEIIDKRIKAEEEKNPAFREEMERKRRLESSVQGLQEILGTEEPAKDENQNTEGGYQLVKRRNNLIRKRGIH